MILLLIIPHAGGLTVGKNPLCKVGGRLDMTFAGEICEVTENGSVALHVTAVASMLSWHRRRAVSARSTSAD